MASGETNAGTAVMSETVDLCEDDNNNNNKDVGVLLNAVSNDSSVAPTASSTSDIAAASIPAASSAVIDLCNDDDDDSSPAAQYAALMARDFSNRKRKRAKKTTTTPKEDYADAICIDDSKPAAARLQDPTAAYRQALGPLRMDFVDSFPGHRHHFQSQKQHPGLKTNKLYRELLEYKLNLPIELSSSIFVRVLESRLDLMRALITGPEGTPYANGCFYFDLHVHDYPKKAPTVQFLTTGQGKVRFNPNLYNSGKVCLSLLGTWSGPGWQANQSTLLQVLVSIQGLILVSDPFYNEPGFQLGKHEKQAEAYNKNIRKHTLEHAMDAFLKQALKREGQKQDDYPEFTDVMIHHFCERANAIEEQLEEWMDEDKSIKTLAERVRKNLRSLVAKYNKAPEAAPAAAEVVTLY